MQQDLEKGFLWFLLKIGTAETWWNSIDSVKLDKTRWNYTYSTWIYMKLHESTMLPISHQNLHRPQGSVHGAALRLHQETAPQLRNRIREMKESDWSSSTNYVVPQQHQTQLDSYRTLFWWMISGVANWCYRIWLLSRSPHDLIFILSNRMESPWLVKYQTMVTMPMLIYLYTVYIPLCKYVCSH
jgi:hypothetical protein